MAYIKGISYYLPERVLTNEQLAREFPDWDVQKAAHKIGVTSRHIAATDETASDLAQKAALKFFHEYSIDPATIDFVLLCTQSPDYFTPATACILQDKLGIPVSAGALDFNLGCSGWVYGLAVAEGLISSGAAHNVLLLTAETYSKYIHPSDKGNRLIFGDGAAACLVCEGDGTALIGQFVFGTDGSGAQSLIVKTGAARQKDATGNSAVDSEGHLMRDDWLYMDGGAIFAFVLRTIPPLVDQVLCKNGIDTVGADYYVFHQANKYMLSSLRKACAISKECFYVDLEQTGNTVSSTIPIALKDCLVRGVIHSGMNVMVAGFGVGLSWAACVLRF